LLIDLSHPSGKEDLLSRAEEAMQFVRSAGTPRSVRGLVDLTKTPINKTGREALKRMSRNNGPWMMCVAFVGLGPALSQVFRAFLALTGRFNHRVFGTREEALDWLASM
jgi:hypothetical protein